jgi:hypothetical protein
MRNLVYLSLVGLAVGLNAWAQPPAGEPDVEIQATVKAKTVRFEQVPQVKVQFGGGPNRDTQWTGQRHNLPTPVRAGVTYRNVSASTRIRTHLLDPKPLEAVPHQP